MAWIPRPHQIVDGATNVAHKALYGHHADLRPMPRTLIDDGELREVYHYRPHAGVQRRGEPVLLVTPLAAPSMCFDLRRGCSLVEHLVGSGRPTYLVEYGAVSFSNRRLGVEHWVDEVIPQAIRAASEHAGDRPVHVVGWSLGGIFAVLTAADQHDLPIASMTVLGSPFDVEQVPLIAPLRPLLNVADGVPLSLAYRILGGAPKPIVKRVFQYYSFDKMITKPLAIARHLDDREFLAQIEAVDRFTENMIAYPGRSFGQLYHRFVRDNSLAHGRLQVGDRTVDIATLATPLLVFAGSSDGIAPVPSVRALMALVPKAKPARFEVVPGGHLGLLTGRAARRTTWRTLDAFLDEHSLDEHSRAEHGRADGARAATATNANTTPTAPNGPRPDIGTNPKRRHSSASSRALADGPAS
ncbi:alpha/beta fold hydrolase [Solicola gregarius]|uniref:Alpha/beta fold hydrolase n=1 Tax=Solicola gregarius TaxID=2908642 RepID=A0AA46YMT3_9ACTN|nr:alpha/beta fold hydrolase [Solicola gregarius]UYM06806.1 alpha/beta fold hydrolase [Solicola gregarius]